MEARSRVDGSFWAALVALVFMLLVSALFIAGAIGFWVAMGLIFLPLPCYFVYLARRQR